MMTFGMNLEIVLPIYKDLELNNSVISVRAPKLPNLVFYTEFYRDYEGYRMYRLLSEPLIDNWNAQTGMYEVEVAWTDTDTDQSVSDTLLLDIMPTWEYAAGVREGWIVEVTLE